MKFSDNMVVVLTILALAAIAAAIWWGVIIK